MSGQVSFRKVAGASRYRVFAGEQCVGTVYNNGARKMYGLHWSAVAVNGEQVAKSGSRRAAAEALARKAGK